MQEVFIEPFTLHFYLRSRMLQPAHRHIKKAGSLFGKPAFYCYNSELKTICPSGRELPALGSNVTAMVSQFSLLLSAA